MKIIQSLNDYNSSSDGIVTLGTFDGVHHGHKELFEQMIRQAKINNAKTYLLTFWPHPKYVVNPNKTPPKLLMTHEEKIEHLSKTAIDCLVSIPFTEDFSQISPKDFLEEILIYKLKVKNIYIGYDHRFGKDREGDYHFLLGHQEEYKYQLHQIKKIEIDGIKPSSTNIRKYVSEGDMEMACKLLGRNYSLRGSVTTGDRIGRKIGFPTANIAEIAPYKLLPKDGVYVVKSSIQRKTYWGISNIGARPTLNNINKTVEAHYFDFNKDIYSNNIEVKFLKYIRPQIKFSRLQELSDQINEDKKTALNYLKNEGLL